MASDRIIAPAPAQAKYSSLGLAALYAAACLIVLQLARLAYFLTLRTRLEATPYTALLKTWFLGLRFDVTATAMFVGLPVLMLALPRPTRIDRAWQWTWHGVACVGVIALTLACIADFYFLAQLQRHIGQEIMTIANDLSFIGAFAVDSAKWGLMVLAIAVALIARGYIAIVQRSQKRTSLAYFLVVFLCTGVAARGSIGGKPLNAIDAFDADSYELSQLQLNGAFSMAKAIGRDGPQVTQRDFEKALAQLDYGPQANPFARHVSHGPQRNVIVFLLESWSATYVDAFSNGKPLGVTPTMDNLAREGIVFANFYAAGQRSYEGVQATLSGLPALPGVPTLTEGLTLRTSRLGAIAAGQGMRTIFMQASARRSLRLDSVASALGFAEYYGREDVARILLNYPDANAFQFGLDHETMQGLADRLHGESKPFIAFLFSGATHTPVASPPAQLQSSYPKDHPDKPFLDAIHYSDWSIGQFMARARLEPWFDNTVFIFTADHTVGVEVEMRDKFHIPLVIYAPKLFAHRVDTRIASQVDIFDTVISLTGAEASYASFGHSLLDAPMEKVALIRSGENIGLITPQHCFMYTPNAPTADTVAMRLAAYRTALYGVIQRNNWMRLQPSLAL